MDKKTILAFILIGLILVIWGPYLKWISPPQQPTDSQDVRPQSDQSRDIPHDVEKPPIEPSESLIQAPATLSTVDSLEISREIIVDTDLYRAIFSTRGGTIRSFRLKSFEGVGNQWVELLPSGAMRTLGLAMNTMEGVLDFSEYIFECDVDSVIMNEERSSAAMIMSIQLKNGALVEKVLRFHNGSYSFDLEVTIDGMSRYVPTREYELVWGAGLAATEKDIKEDMQKMSVYALLGNDVAKYDFGRKENTIERREEGTCNWIGIRNKYFLVSMIPRSQSAQGIRVDGKKSRLTRGKDAIELKEYDVSLRMPLSTEGLTKHSFEVYLGPQSYSLLKTYSVGLERCMDMGWTIIRPISRIILAFFVFMHKYIPNYGLIIIIFTVLLKVLFYPLTHKQLEATKKMQELQPKLAALKEKYKKDPQRLNKETMAMYKEAGANPLGGCLPLLLQMPVFFALFTVFKSTIELRRAEFVFWITDLSLKDPYLILPIVMAITMFVQQKMTMKDPKQAAMVYLMPLIMFFFLMNFASGLVLYWTVFNILSILQQLFIERRGKLPANQ